LALVRSATVFVKQSYCGMCIHIEIVLFSTRVVGLLSYHSVLHQIQVWHVWKI